MSELQTTPEQEIKLLDLWRLVAEYLTNVKRRSPKTVCAYKHVWFRLVRRLGNMPVSELSLLTLDKHPEWLQKHSNRCVLKDQTIFRNMMAIRQVVRYGRKVLERMNRNDIKFQAADIECGRTAYNDDTTFLTKEEICQLYAATKDARTLWQLRDAAIVRCLISGGFRAGEFVQLRWSDVTFSADSKTATVKIREEIAKCRKSRQVELNEQAVKSLLAYRAMLPYEHAEIWISERRKRNGDCTLERNALQRIVASACLKAGIIQVKPEYANLLRNQLKKEHCSGNWITPHSFRRTCATVMYLNRVGIIDIQHYLGHSTILTTQRYVKPVMTDRGKLSASTVVLSDSEQNVVVSEPSVEPRRAISKTSIWELGERLKSENIQPKTHRKVLPCNEAQESLF